MIQTKKKIKKNEILLRARKAQLDQESRTLNSIKEEKLEHLKKLEQFQKSYINGVNTLNEERQSGDRLKLATLERSVDFSKSQWYKCLREIKDIEEQEKQQIERVLTAQQNLKTIEKVQEGNVQKLRKEIDKKEQAFLDESTINRFSNNR